MQRIFSDEFQECGNRMEAVLQYQWVKFRLTNHYFIIFTVTLASIFAVYFPFILTDNMDAIFRHWDGPNYAFLAKAMYNVPIDHPLSNYTTPDYFAAHLPVYPLTIRLFSFMGYFNAMLFSTALYTTLSTIIFYKLLVETKTVQDPLWSAIISLFIPVRYLLNHSIGATEAPFIFFTLSSIYAYIRGYYLLAFFLGGISGITRITGILIGGAYLAVLIQEKKWKYIPALALVGLPLLLLFTFYHFHYGNFFAYLGTNYSDTNRIFLLKPFELFKIYSNNGEVHSAEFFLVLYSLYAAGTALLWYKNKLFFWYCLFTLLFSVFIFHPDLSRYLIPLAPLAIVVAYDKVLSRKSIRWLIIPLLFLSYQYVWGTLHHNQVDISSYNTLKTYLEQDLEKNKLVAEFNDLSIHACAYNTCSSSIYVRFQKKNLATTRGLNLFAYDQGEVEFLTAIDNCNYPNAYTNNSLNNLIQNLSTPPEKVILLSQDTISCRPNKPPIGIKHWAKSYDLPGLETIGYRQTYIGVLDVKTRKTIEYKDDNNSIFFPR